MDIVRPTLLRGPNCSRLVVQVHDIHCAAATASCPATAPALEFLRAFIDTSGFFLPSTAQLCSAPDVQMLLYSVSALMPPCKTSLRLRNRVFCVSLPESSLEPSEEGLFTPLASSRLSAACTDFMQSLRDSILEDSQPENSASDVCNFLTTSVKEIYSVCKSSAPKLLFDVSAMVRILRRVHADLATVPFDFIRTARTAAKMKDNMPGSVLMGVFGNLMHHGSSEDLWDREQETMQQLGAEQVCMPQFRCSIGNFRLLLSAPLFSVAGAHGIDLTPPYCGHCAASHLQLSGGPFVEISAYVVVYLHSVV